jgi:L-aspartate oxidase
VLRDAMTRLVGLERDAGGLRAALAIIEGVERAGAPEPALLNMTATAKLVTAAALVRNESRGAHFRSDHPQTDETGVRSFLTLAEAETIAAASPAQQAARAAV